MPGWDDLSDSMANLVAGFQDMMMPIDEMVIGHKKRLMDAGFLPNNAEQMVVQSHAYFMTHLIELVGKEVEESD